MTARNRNGRSFLTSVLFILGLCLAVFGAYRMGYHAAQRDERQATAAKQAVATHVVDCMSFIIDEDKSTPAQIKAAHPDCAGVYADHSAELAQAGLGDF